MRPEMFDVNALVFGAVLLPRFEKLVDTATTDDQEVCHRAKILNDPNVEEDNSDCDIVVHRSGVEKDVAYHTEGHAQPNEQTVAEGQ